MEYLLEIFSGIENLSLEMETFIHSILYDSNSTIENFVNNYGLALEHLCKTTSNNLNLKFIRRRKQFIQVMGLEQTRKQDDDLVFHVRLFLINKRKFIQFILIQLKYHGNNSETTNILTLSGIHSTSNTDRKDATICLDESSPSDNILISAITLDNNDKNIPSYLPVVNNDKKSNTELILHLTIDEPHI